MDCDVTASPPAPPAPPPPAPPSSYAGGPDAIPPGLPCYGDTGGVFPVPAVPSWNPAPPPEPPGIPG